MSETPTKQITSPQGVHPWGWIPSLYFIEGLPNAIIATITVILYKDLGLSVEAIAFYTGLLYLPWVIKPFWSPFVDIIRTKRWWIIAMQLLMAVAFAGVALALPGQSFLVITIGLFWLAAFTSATNDIASDGFYMLSLSEFQQSYFVGIRSTFYRVSTWFVQFVVIYLAGYLETRLGSKTRAWEIVFYIIAAIFFIGSVYHSLVLPRPAVDVDRRVRSAGMIFSEFIQAFATFFKKPGVGVALAFMLLYRLPEAQLVKLINIFLMDSPEAGGLGLTKEVISVTYGFYGIIGLTIGGIVGGLYAARRGLARSIKPMAWSMSLTCLTFVLLSRLDNPSLLTVDICIFIEQFGYGFGFAAYMLYLIYFSEGEFATAHYAICTAFMAIGLMVPGMAAGWIQSLVGYSDFFIWTMICCVATIAVAYIVKIDPQFGIKTPKK